MVPANIPFTLPIYALETGITDVAQARGFESELVDLVLGLKIALNAPDAAQRFLDGEEVFKGAVVKDGRLAPPVGLGIPCKRQAPRRNGV